MGDVIEVNFEQLSSSSAEETRSVELAEVVDFPQPENSDALVEYWRRRRAGQTLANRMVKQWR